MCSNCRTTKLIYNTNSRFPSLPMGSHASLKTPLCSHPTSSCTANRWKISVQPISLQDPASCRNHGHVTMVTWPLNSDLMSLQTIQCVASTSSLLTTVPLLLQCRIRAPCLRYPGAALAAHRRQTTHGLPLLPPWPNPCMGSKSTI